MDKPIMKCEVVVDCVLKSIRVIHLYATNDAVADMKDFGQIDRLDSAIYPSGLLRFAVDARYDFDEVLAYIQNYG